MAAGAVDGGGRRRVDARAGRAPCGSAAPGRARSGLGGRLAYAVAAPVLHGLARLPLSALHRISDAAFVVVYRLLRYRRRVTRENLRRAFPQAREEELRDVERRFYRHLCDLAVETLKLLTLEEEEIPLRMRGRNLELLDGYVARGQSVVLVLGHCGNWEWAIPLAELCTPLRLEVVYRPVKNPGFEALFCRARSRFGSALVPMRQAPRRLIRPKERPTGMVFVADQFPRIPHPHWTRFLGRDTAFVRGPERIARRVDAPVLYVEVNRVARGCYQLGLEVLCERPSETADGEITERFARRLEQQIRKAPESWLWSHRRWKAPRPAQRV